MLKISSLCAALIIGLSSGAMAQTPATETTAAVGPDGTLRYDVSTFDVAGIELGMTPDQVAYYLGTPDINDTLTPNRWDYVYMYLPGTYGEKADIKQTIGKQRLSIYFDATPVVTKIEGRPSIPAEQPAIPLPDRLF